MSPRTNRLRRLAAGAALLLAALAVAVFFAVRGDDGGSPRPDRATSPTSPTSPGTTPAPTSPIPTAQVEFPTDCRAVPGSRPLGLGIPRPTRLAQNPVEQATFASAFACLESITGAPPVLRTQLPIDVTRRDGAPGGFEYSELSSFAYLLRTTGSTGVVSVRSHDFTRCSARGDGRPRSRATLAPGESLQSCEFPSIPLYGQLFAELRDAIVKLAPSAQLTFTAWNEPDHPMFTLQRIYGQRGAARRAGKYWAAAAGIVGSERLLAGEFADEDLPTLLALREAFVEGTGGLTPSVWAIHPYRDLTSGGSDIETGFAGAVAPSPTWVTEATPRISGKGGLSGRPTGQLRRGTALRARLTESTTPLILYLLIPPIPPASDDDDGWDSAIADRQGRARPFICGLADLPAERCPGNPDAFGG